VGRFPPRLIYIAAAWSIVFGFFCLGLTDDDATCNAPNNQDLFEYVPLIDAKNDQGTVDVA